MWGDSKIVGSMFIEFSLRFDHGDEVIDNDERSSNSPASGSVVTRRYSGSIPAQSS